jgi:acetyltransferase-like isoleucine patch superfamily enzyme
MKDSQKLAIFGSSGHAFDIQSTFLKLYPNGKVAFIKSDQENYYVEKYSNNGYGFIIGIGDNHRRKSISEKYKKLNWVSVISDSVFIGQGTTFEEGNFVGFGVFISHNVKVAKHTIINSNSTVGHDAVLCDYSHICTNVSIGGNGVTIENGAFLGSSVVTINKPITIGEWSQISLGSVVSKSIPARKLFIQYRKEVILPTLNKN